MDVDMQALNRVLAEFVGTKVVQIGSSGELIYGYEAGPDYRIDLIWDPCHDHNNMAMAKNKLRENGYDYWIEWSKKDGHFTAHISLDLNPSGDPNILYRTGMASDELLAFALAVKAISDGR